MKEVPGCHRLTGTNSLQPLVSSSNGSTEQGNLRYFAITRDKEEEENNGRYKVISL